jgi:hypothetical protein
VSTKPNTMPVGYYIYSYILDVGIRYENKGDRHKDIKTMCLMYTDPGYEMKILH